MLSYGIISEERKKNDYEVQKASPIQSERESLVNAKVNSDSLHQALDVLVRAEVLN